jgi:cytochrome b561
MNTANIKQWRTSASHWGRISIAIHWLTVITVFSLFALGLWMVELNLYDSWYKKGPNLHKSIGILLLMLTLLRIIWRRIEGKPGPLSSHTAREQNIARWMHVLLYTLLISVMVFGYLISTADGRAIEVFGLFPIPATLQGIDKQEDIAGVIHLWLAIVLISMVALHALAAIKHHFFDKDQTLKRMLGR